MARRYYRYAATRFVPNAPNRTLWILALVIGILGILGQLVAIDFVTANSFLFVAIGFVLLAIGTTMRNV